MTDFFSRPSLVRKRRRASAGPGVQNKANLPPDVQRSAVADHGNPFHNEANRLLVPMDARAPASPAGADEYVFYAQGGWSWSIPYIAGAYALAVQVEPKITPERFWALAMQTGRTIQVHHKDKTFDLGPILDLVRLIDAVRRSDLSDEDAVAAELAKYRSHAVPIPSQATMPKDIAAKISQLDIDTATRADVIEHLGAPLSYVFGDKVLDANDLPRCYAMVYPAGVQVIIGEDHIRRVTFLTPGYPFRGKIQVGSSIEEVLEILGPPEKTIEGAKGADVSIVHGDDVFYKNIDGVEGNCLYRSQAQGVALWFTDNRVSQMMLLPKDR